MRDLGNSRGAAAFLGFVGELLLPPFSNTAASKQTLMRRTCLHQGVVTSVLHVLYPPEAKKSCSFRTRPVTCVGVSLNDGYGAGHQSFSRA